MRWCGTVQTSDPSLVTMAVFGSSCPGALDPSPDVVVLATSDKDLIPLVRVAKQRGAFVVVLGSDFTAIPLREMADEHVTYRQLITEAGVRYATEAGPGRQPAQVQTFDARICGLRFHAKIWSIVRERDDFFIGWKSEGAERKRGAPCQKSAAVQNVSRKLPCNRRLRFTFTA